jgi:hypothetical protein
MLQQCKNRLLNRIIRIIFIIITTWKNHCLMILFMSLTNNKAILLGNISNFQFLKEILTNKFLKHNMMDLIKNQALAILTICTKLRITISAKIMKKIIFKSLNIFRLGSKMISMEHNKNLMKMVEQCLQMVFKLMTDQPLALIFNKMGPTKIFKWIKLNNLSFK